jgi:signal transduction histidine kinase
MPTDLEAFQHDLLRILGHDLRSSVAAILVGAEMLSSPQGDGASRAGVVTRIASFAHRLNRMTDQVVDMTRARLGGGIPLARCSTQLDSLLRSVFDDVARTYPRQELRLDCAAGLRGVWDPDRLGQAVASLVTNAAQYGLADAPIDVMVTRGGGHTTIGVHNQLHDAPIEPRALARLFEPCHGGRERAHTGLGLGLYVAQQIAHAHGGTIAVESSPAGTTFRIALPDLVAAG